MHQYDVLIADRQKRLEWAIIAAAAEQDNLLKSPVHNVDERTQFLLNLEATGRFYVEIVSKHLAKRKTKTRESI